MRPFARFLFSAGLFLAASVILLEVLARLMLPEQVDAFRRQTIGDDRILLISAPYMHRNGYYTFAPNAEFREVAYYPNEEGRLTAEYDCRYKADSQGFLSNAIGYGEASILLLGDSFVQGQGGCDWLQRLSPDKRQTVYSAAVQGHGFAHWQRIVEDLSRIRAPQKLLAAFITDDFYRGLTPSDEGEQRCLERSGPCSYHYLYPVSDDMQTIAQKRWEDRKDPLRLLRANPVAGLKALMPATVGVAKMLRSHGGGTEARLADSIRIVKHFADTYDLRLIWIGERRERDAATPQQQAVADALAKANVQATRCELPADGYMPRDGHPNAKGYDRLRDCVEDAIESWTRVAASPSPMGN